tara:strand:+ start:2712 stop:4934 length:2223 start_codon:yes stop_codon:yes gene_type:complete
MAIREYGESLLQDVRKRKDDQAKAARKRQKKADLLQLGGVLIGAVGSSKLTNQFNSFQQNKDVLNTNIMITAAEKTDKTLDGLAVKIEESGLSAKEYFLNDQVDKDLENALSGNVKFNKTIETQNIYKKTYRDEFLKNQEAIKKAEIAASQYEQAREAQERFKSSGTKEEAFNLGKSRLSSSPITAFFGGARREEEAVQAYRESTFAKSAGQLAMFDEVLKQTGGDFIEARKMSDDLKLDKSKLSEWDSVVEQSDIIDGFVVTIQGKKDYEGKTVWNKDSVSRVDLRTDAGKVKELKTQFDVTANLMTDIDDKGIVAARKEGFNPAPTTPAEYKKNLELYNKYAISNSVVTLSAEEKAGKEAWSKSLLKLMNSDDFLQEQADLDAGMIEEQKIMSTIKADNEGIPEEELLIKYTENKTLTNIRTQNNAIVSNIFRQKDNLKTSIYEVYPTLNPAYTAEEETAEETTAFIAVGADADDTRGVRNNNYLNIKENLTLEKNNPWEGKVGSDGTYLQFETPAMGLRAADKILQSYKKKSINTITDIITEWAPPTDDNPTEDYIDFIASELAIDENAEIDLSDPEIRASLLASMTAMESEKDISSDEVLSLIEQANSEVADREVEDEDLVIETVSKTPPKNKRTLLGVEVVSGKSLDTLTKNLFNIDTELTGNVPSNRRENLLKQRIKIQKEFDKYEKVKKLKDPSYVSTPSKAYALRMLSEDRRTISEEESIENYVKRMKGELK